MADEISELIVKIGSVRTGYGLAVVPVDARWVDGWDSRGLPVEYADGRQDHIQWTPPAPTPRFEWYGQEIH